MRIAGDIAQVRDMVGHWRAAGERVAFVPTMGNLHDGHIALVARAREVAARVVVSIFVNPLQFGAGEDLERYPRTPEADSERLRAAGADLLFMPEEAQMYPRGRQGVTFVEVPGLSDILCGAARPGHFRGVATVVAKLFHIVQPDVAVFGQKDYQQLTVLRRMVEDLCIPVELIGVPTVREADGLAMSSRNGYLSAGQRAVAPALARALRTAAQRLAGGDDDFAAVEAAAVQALQAAGFLPDYVSVRRAADLQPPAVDEPHLVVLAAAWLGTTRLIDNLLISR